MTTKVVTPSWLALLVVVMTITATTAADDEPATLHRAAAPVDSGNRYIIAPKYNMAVETMEEHLLNVTSQDEKMEFKIIWKIPIGLKLIFAEMNEAALEAALRSEVVGFIEEDSYLYVQSSSGEEGAKGEAAPVKEGQQTDQWGLDRIDQRNMPLDGMFSVKANGGTGANIYVMGTGVHVKHEEFGGRASNIYDYRGEDENGRDCNGHGTHMASLAAGKTYGVAKNATIHGMRLTQCRGRGKLSDAVRGIEWLSVHKKLNCVALFGLSAERISPALDNALHRIYQKGCIVVVPAGNNNTAACDVSPARLQGAITVGATTKQDYAVYYTNQDKCVDIFAPGRQIEGAFYDGKTNTFVETIGGTSMAAAYVAGASALHLGNEMALFKVKDYLLSHATKYQLQHVEDNTPNKLLYVGKVTSLDDYKWPMKPKISVPVPEESDKEAKDEANDEGSPPKDTTKTEL